MPQYHVVLCDGEGEGAGQTGNKQYLLFKVKGLAYVGMKSNSIIAKNLFNHFFISVLSPFTAIIVPTTESKWKQIMVFATSSYSQYIFPSRIQSSSITGGLGMFFATLPPLFLCLDSLTAVCQRSSPKDWWTLASSCPCLRKHHHWWFTFISSVLLVSCSVQSVLLRVIFLISCSLILEQKSAPAFLLF